MNQKGQFRMAGASANALPNTVFERLVSNIASADRDPKKSFIGFALSWIAFFFILHVMPTPEGLSPAGKATLAVVTWACITWVSECVPVGISGLMIPMLLVMTKAVPGLGAAVSGINSNPALLTLVAFIVAAIIMTSGLDKRIALGILHGARIKTVNGVIWGMFAVNMILAMIIPGANPRGAILLPIMNGITGLLGDAPEEREAKKAIVIQSIVYASMISGMCLMTAHLPNLILVGLFEKELNISISYFDWFLMQWPYLGMFVVTQWWVQYHFKTRRFAIRGGAEMIKKTHDELPRTSTTEFTILAIFVLTAVLWMTEKWHKIPTLMIAIMSLSALFIPGFMPFRWRMLEERTIWGTFILLGGALSLSRAMSSSGLGKWLASVIDPIAIGKPWWMVLLILMVGTHFIRLGMLSNVAAVSLFAPILLALAPKVGLHPVAFTMLVSDTDTFAYILPTQVTVAVIAYSTGTFSSTDYAKVGWVSVLLAIAYGIFIMAPWYAFLGIPVWDPSAPWPFAK
ncbi:MAG: anion permease [Rhodospirillales bacterium]|nr:anion permease [Rhodospirillales bacterium]